MFIDFKDNFQHSEREKERVKCVSAFYSLFVFFAIFIFFQSVFAILLQSTLVITAQTITAPASFVALSTTGGSGTGAVTFAITSAGTAVCSVSGTTLSYTNAGTCTVTATKAADIIYNEASSDAQTFTVNIADPINQATLLTTAQTITAPASFVALSTTGGSGTGAVTFAITSAGTAVCSVSGTTLSYTNAGTCTVTATKAADSSYNSALSDAQTFTVSKITPTITWANPANITSGTALSVTQLNASSVTAGTFIYTPASGTVLSVGNDQILSATFTPTDATNYNNVTQTATITVSILGRRRSRGGGGGGEEGIVKITPTEINNYTTATKIINITVNSDELVSPDINSPSDIPSVSIEDGSPLENPLDSNYIFTLFLKLGSSGQEVFELQKVLKSLGYFQGTETGYYGPLTKTAVILFQKVNNIPPYPGFVGPATRNVLNNVSNIPPIVYTSVITAPVIETQVKPLIKIRIQ